MFYFLFKWQQQHAHIKTQFKIHTSLCIRRIRNSSTNWRLLSRNFTFKTTNYCCCYYDASEVTRHIWKWEEEGEKRPPVESLLALLESDWWRKRKEKKRRKGTTNERSSPLLYGRGGWVNFGALPWGSVNTTWRNHVITDVWQFDNF